MNHNDTTIKDEWRLLYKNMYLSFYCKGSKRVTQGFTVRRSWRLNKDSNTLTPTLMAISVVSFSFYWCSIGGPGAQLSAKCWLSQPHLVTYGSPKLTGGPEGPFGWVWLSLPHLVSNSSYLQLNRGPRELPPPGSGFLYHILSPTGLQNYWGPWGPLLLIGGFPYQKLTPTLWSPTLTSCLHRVI